MANKIQKINQQHFHELTVEILKHKFFKLQIDHQKQEYDHIKIAKLYNDAYIETYNILVEENQ